MSESTEPQPRTVPTPEEMPWSISYLHDSIQDLRVEVRGLRDEVRTDIQNLRDEVRTDIQNLRDETNNRIDETNRVLGSRIDETNNRIDETNREIRALHKRMDTYFLWMMGTLITITGVLIAVIKL